MKKWYDRLRPSEQLCNRLAASSQSVENGLKVVGPGGIVYRPSECDSLGPNVVQAIACSSE
jgi:hypothetical protein